ncbi:MAG: glycosyltransferase, partial [Reichenbachiella sp.]
MVEIAVVILNFNGKNYLEQFLPGVILHSAVAEVIVVDNCSTDDSVAFLQEHHSDVELMLFDKNYGYTGGYNKAIAKINHKYT